MKDFSLALGDFSIIIRFISYLL